MIKRLLLGLIAVIVMALPTKSQIGVGPAPYCMPLYSSIPCNSPGPSNANGNGVNDFIHSYNTAGGVVNIVNNNSGCNAQNLSGIKNYRLWGCEHYLRVTPGQFITSNFQSGNVYPQGATVFVDWNQDGIFNAAAFTGVVPGGERMTSTAGVPAAAVMSPMPGWTVPNVPAGVYRMRVRCAYFTNGNTIGPCINYGFGETEEYFVYCNMAPNTSTINLTSNSPVCLGSQVQINSQVILGPNSGTCTANTYTWSWTGPMGFTSNVMNPTFTATNVLQSGVYTLNITPPTGCGCATTNTIQIWVNPNPTTSITNNGPVCQGSTLNFSNTVNGSGTMTYSWTGPNGFTANTPQVSFAQAQPTNTGIYNFTVVSSFTNGGQCVATSSSSSAVVPVAQVSVTPFYTVCQGSNILLQANVNGATSFTWTGPNSFTSSLSNPSLNSVIPQISGDYSVTAFFASNQTTLVCSSSAVSNVSVVPQSPVVAFATPNVCQGAVATVSATALNNPSYIWSGPNGWSSVNQINSINNIQPQSSGNYSVQAVWSIGSVSCSTSDFAVISVVPVPSITVIPNITLCQGQGTSLTANAQGATSYTWTGPNGFFVTQPNTQFQNLTPSWSGQYTVNAQFTNGNISCYNTGTTNLLVKPILQFSLTPIIDLCYGQTLVINGPSGATSYTWNGPATQSNSQNLVVGGVTSQNAGLYNLAVSLDGCVTTGQAQVLVREPIKWKQVPNNLILCKGDAFTVTALPEGGSGNYAFNWQPFYNITGPTGWYQTGIAQETTIYNISVYDIACPTYTINHGFSIIVNSAPVPSPTLNAWKGCEPFCDIFNSRTNELKDINWSFGPNSVWNGDGAKVCLNAGTYTLNVTTVGLNGCKETFNRGVIEVYKNPNADFQWTPQTITSVTGGEVQFNQIDTRDCINWLWEFKSGDNSELQTPTRVFDQSGNYLITLVSTNKWNCKDTVSKTIKVEDEFLLWIPDVFTPNGDGANDTFKPKVFGAKSYQLEVFDRWGELIYQGGEWDGKFKTLICQDGVYVYKIVAIGNNGKIHTRTGHVTLMK